MLKSIELQNFQKHTSLQADFTKGLNLCFGPNWAGKTSLMRAVLYALYGSKALPIKQTNLVTTGQKSMSVSLSFEVDGSPFRVVRGTSGARLFREGRDPIAVGHGPVTEEIEKLIGQAKQFLNYQVARQNETDSLLLLGSAKLAQHIESVLGIDLIDKVLDRIKEERGGASELSARIGDLERSLIQMQADVDSAKAKRIDIETAAVARERFLPPVQEAIVQLRTQIGEWERARSQHQQLEWTRDKAQEALARAIAKVAAVLPVAKPEGYDTLREQSQDLSEMTQLLGRRQEAERALQAANTNWQNALTSAQMFHVEHPEEVMRECDAKILKLNESLGEITSRLSAEKKALSTGVCHACHRPFDDFDPAQARDRISALEVREVETRKELQEAQAVRGKAAQAQSALDKAKSEESLYQAAQVTLAEIPVICEESLQQARAAFDYLSVRCQEYDRYCHLWHESDRERQEAKEKLAEAEGRLRAAGTLVSQEDLDNAKAKLKENEEVVSQQLQYLAREHGMLAEISNTISRLNAGMKPVKEQLAEARKSQARHVLLDRLAKYLRKNRDSFSEQAWDQLMALTSRFISDASGGVLENLRRDSSGDFLFVEEGEERALEVASGMQRAIIGVGLKVSLAETLGSPFSVLLLDEVSAAAEETNAIRLTEQLALFGSQVLLISHRESDAALAHSVISLRP